MSTPKTNSRAAFNVDSVSIKNFNVDQQVYSIGKVEVGLAGVASKKEVQRSYYNIVSVYRKHHGFDAGFDAERTTKVLAFLLRGLFMVAGDTGTDPREIYSMTIAKPETLDLSQDGIIRNDLSIPASVFISSLGVHFRFWARYHALNIYRLDCITGPWKWGIRYELYFGPLGFDTADYIFDYSIVSDQIIDQLRKVMSMIDSQ
ncbi:hypothetical protein CLU79DRAFT_722203 [Phycomyces nitens]|nr:hypothetical protein CLU79DRAFT_722203 [Phycomyces nitens]